MPYVAGVVMQDTSCALRTASVIIVDELMLTFALWVYSNRTGVSRESALDKAVDLILLAHDDELIVAMHDQFLGTVLEFLAGGALMPTTVTPYLSCTCTSSMLRPTAYSGV